MSLLTLEAKLERSDSSTPWGFRMQGGKDFSSPLTIQRVNPGSLAAKCGLQTGDIILRIGTADTSPLRHKEAQNSIVAAGNRLDLLLQRGGAQQRAADSSYERFSTPTVNAGTLQNAGGYNPPQSFNAAPKPFGSQQPTPAPFRPAAYEDGLSQRTHNLSLSPGGSSDASSSSSSVVSAIPAPSSSFSAPPPPPPPPPAQQQQQQQRGGEPSYLRSAAEKYTESEDTDRPAQHQSRSFKYLQDLMDSGKEPPKALKTSNPPALHARSVSPVEDRSEGVPGGGPVQMLGPSKPGTVKAIMSQRYNTPIGLYSSNEVMSQFEGQSKFLLTDNEEEGGVSRGDASASFPPPPPPPPPSQQVHVMEAPLPSPPPPPPPASLNENGGGAVKYFPSETLKLLQEEEKGRGVGGDDKTAHSRSFLKLQKQLDSTGAPPAPQFGKAPGTGAPPAPQFGKAPGTGAPPAPQFGKAPGPPKPASTFQPKPAPAPAAPVAKTWTPSSAPPPAPASGAPRLFGRIGGGGGSTPKPTGMGAKRGRVGEAVTNPGGGPGRIPVCSGCSGPIRGPFVTAMGNCWCPDHFVCANAQCGVKLIDIGFVEEGGNLYCERDYERYLAPHCKKCNNTILGECVNALQSTWHPDCFLCSHCKLPIGGNQFHIEDGKPFCEKDWAAMFQTMCASCDFPIEPGDRWVEAMGKNFHAECFNCATCQVSLEGQPFVAKAGKAFCKKHAR
ncbi:hypothetical protein ACOMHN_026787 [Nucella lapillus]